jgi:YggT family protein
MVVFDAIDNVALFVNIFTSVYLLTIFAYIIISWFRVPYSLQPVQRFLYDVCEPYLGLWRRMLPMLRLGMIDLTPMVAVLALLIVSQVVIALLHGLQ